MIDEDLKNVVIAQGKAIEAMSKRIQSLEEYVRLQREARTSRFTVKALIHSESQAFQQWMKEMSGKLGFSESLVWPRFQASVLWHYDRYLQKASDTAPTLSSLSDTRELNQIPTDDAPPPILPPE